MRNRSRRSPPCRPNQPHQPFHHPVGQEDPLVGGVSAMASGHRQTHSRPRSPTGQSQGILPAERRWAQVHSYSRHPPRGTKVGLHLCRWWTTLRGPGRGTNRRVVLRRYAPAPLAGCEMKPIVGIGTLPFPEIRKRVRRTTTCLAIPVKACRRWLRRSAPPAVCEGDGDAGLSGKIRERCRTPTVGRSWAAPA